METTDMRSLSRDARHERRVQVIRLREAGCTYDQIAVQTGLSRTGVFNICTRYARQGAHALHDRIGGYQFGQRRRLSMKQEQIIQHLICSNTPDQLKMTHALWTRRAVSELIMQRFGMALPVRTMGLYLSRWGFTPQKPIRHAYEQSPAAVRKWLIHDYPLIAARAKREGAQIHWGDETGLRSNDVRGRSFAPKGKTPVVRINSKYEGFSIISSVTNKGEMRWKIFEAAVNAKVLIDFMQRLIKSAQKKVFLILDNLRVHHCQSVKQWLAKQHEHIEVFYLPSYSPELNPDELANADIKQAVTTKAPARTKLQLRKATMSHLHSVQKRPQRICRYFACKSVLYAA